MSDLRTAVDELSRDGSFTLKKFTEDDQCFGNAEIVVSISSLDIRFIRDRGDIWPEVLLPGRPAKWSFYEDVMNALQHPVPRISNPNVVAAMKETVEQINRHLSDILQAFQIENLAETKQKIDQIVQQRFPQI